MILVRTSLIFAFMSSLPRSTNSKNRLETDKSASFGHSVNQSIVQQLTRDGNMRQRARKASPTGDMPGCMTAHIQIGDVGELVKVSLVGALQWGWHDAKVSLSITVWSTQ
jgi:hypothetical protein